ncbi:MULTISPECIES: hypothetical protein [unclassified Bradyrhizobium]|uniref:hypothetical protein n=1 Tax=unclassified Bradyrhizobium TaxID=2631580 RepID=UPI0028EC3B28|nr:MULTISPECIES: hypothetical protein [unclassified Bradyrhizobium]
MARDARDYDNTNRGALFKNEHRNSDRSPDYTGKLNVDGTEYWLSAWLQKAKDGSRYMSVAVRQQDSEAREAKQAKASSKNADIDDEIPF